MIDRAQRAKEAPPKSPESAMKAQKPPKLDCPNCEQPVADADFNDPDYGWLWTSDKEWKCPHCKADLIIYIDDWGNDGENVASLKEVPHGED